MGINQLDKIRHSLAHLLAAAILEMYPGAKLAIGPPVNDGFYYDFELPAQISDSDLKRIENRMRKILKTWDKFSRIEVESSWAKELFAENSYKLEIINELNKSGEIISLYSAGKFLDLCRGGHVSSAKNIDPDCFSLDRIAGAYWRGDEKNAMLTRIYGLAFNSKEELEEYVERREAAKQRDHKKLGRQLELFDFHETAPGMPYWLPNGLIVYNELVDFWRKNHAAHGYQEIATPLINKKELWETSGHWDHYREDMFVVSAEEETYGLKPMNCPNAMIVFNMKKRSYKDLPLRFSDSDTLHRYERSGVLNGLLRARSFRQDDAHNFITQDQIESEYAQIFQIVKDFYGIFNLKFRYRLGTRPKKFIGQARLWDIAESALKKILDQTCGAGNYEVAKGDGAFYGPKVDIIMQDALGRDWQMGTVQLDFQLPQRFNLIYTAKDGSAKTPVVIHRVVYGSLERFIGILIEHTAGKLPVWLSPIQVMIVTIGKQHDNFSEKVADQLKAAGVRIMLNKNNETLSKKILKGKNLKIPYIVIIGDKEVKTNSVTVERYNGSSNKQMDLSVLVNELENKIVAKS